MPYEKQPNSGSLWREAIEKVSQRTGQPYKYYSGDCVIDGKEYWINAFLNTVKTQKGDKEVYNMTFKLKDQQAQKPAVADDGTQIPF